MFGLIKKLFSQKVKIIQTTKGEMEETALEKREGSLENGTEVTNWVEYWHDKELVHRSVNVTLKPQPVAQTIIGGF